MGVGLCQGVQEKTEHITEVLIILILDLLENCYTEVFGISDYRSSIRFKKIKMTHPIWQSRFIKINQIYLKIVTQEFLESLITDLYSDLKNSKWQNLYGSRALKKLIRFT